MLDMTLFTVSAGDSVDTPREEGGGEPELSDSGERGDSMSAEKRKARGRATFRNQHELEVGRARERRRRVKMFALKKKGAEKWKRG